MLLVNASSEWAPHRNLFGGAAIPGLHPLRGGVDRAHCLSACRNESRCSGAVWNCAHQCFLKSGATLRLGRGEEHCTFSHVPKQHFPKCLGVVGDDYCCRETCKSCSAGACLRQAQVGRSCLQTRGKPPCVMRTVTLSMQLQMQAELEREDHRAFRLTARDSSIVHAAHATRRRALRDDLLVALGHGLGLAQAINLGASSLVLQPASCRPPTPHQIASRAITQRSAAAEGCMSMGPKASEWARSALYTGRVMLHGACALQTAVARRYRVPSTAVATELLLLLTTLSDLLTNSPHHLLRRLRTIRSVRFMTDVPPSCRSSASTTSASVPAPRRPISGGQAGGHWDHTTSEHDDSISLTMAELASQLLATTSEWFDHTPFYTGPRELTIALSPLSAATLRALSERLLSTPHVQPSDLSPAVGMLHCAPQLSSPPPPLAPAPAPQQNAIVVFISSTSFLTPLRVLLHSLKVVHTRTPIAIAYIGGDTPLRTAVELLRTQIQQSSSLSVTLVEWTVPVLPRGIHEHKRWHLNYAKLHLVRRQPSTVPHATHAVLMPYSSLY